MSVLTASNVVKIWSEGQSDRAVLYALRKVTTADTMDLSADFLVAKQAAALGTTVAGTAACVVAGTVVTMPAGLVNDAGWLLVWGVSA
jgi:hypothetical protein